MSPEPIKLRTIFMGSSFFAERILSSLIEERYNIISVYTQPDKKSGRNNEVKKGLVKSLAEQHKIPVIQPDRLDEAAVEEIKNQKPDIIIVASYGKILPKTILEIPGFKCVNIHPSLLPKWRGPSPIQNALLAGEEGTGTSIMIMDEKMDTGDILSQRKVPIEKHETASELIRKLAAESASLLIETLPLWIEGKITPQKQDDSQSTMCQLIERADGKIIWSENAETIYNQYRAFHPWPGVFTFWERGDDIKRIKMHKLSLIKNNPEIKHHIGEVFQIGEKIGVQANNGIIIIEEIQIEGKKNMPIEEFLRGYNDFMGSVLK